MIWVGTMIDKYEAIIYWSDEDEAFEAVSLWIEMAREFGDPVPEPRGRRRMLA
jgi:hypothetical protein